MLKRIPCLLLALFMAASLEADPRWWQHDRIITEGDHEKLMPDVALIRAEMGASVVAVVAAGSSLKIAWRAASTAWRRQAV